MVKNGAKGCAYGLILNQKVFDLKENVNSGFKRIETKLAKIDDTQNELFNHMSQRMSKGAVAIWCALIGVIGILIGVLGTFIVAVKLN